MLTLNLWISSVQCNNVPDFYFHKFMLLFWHKCLMIWTFWILLFCLFVSILFGTNLDNCLSFCFFCFFYIEYLNIQNISGFYLKTGWCNCIFYLVQCWLFSFIWILSGCEGDGLIHFLSPPCRFRSHGPVRTWSKMQTCTSAGCRGHWVSRSWRTCSLASDTSSTPECWWTRPPVTHALSNHTCYVWSVAAL